MPTGRRAPPPSGAATVAPLAGARSMTTTPLLWRVGTGWRLWRLSWLISPSYSGGNASHPWHGWCKISFIAL
jgi:hypothetical protein